MGPAITAQLAFAMIFVLCAVVMYRQCGLLKNRDLGYLPERLLVVDLEAAQEIGGPIVRANLAQWQLSRPLSKSIVDTTKER